MRKIQLIVTDLDDTFLAADKTISTKAIQTVSTLQTKNIPFTFITGRPGYAVSRFSDLVGLELPIVSCNGAIIYNQRQVYTRHSFSMAPLETLLTKADSLGLTILYYTSDTEYAMGETPWTKEREESGRGRPIHHPSKQEWKSLTAEKVNIMSLGDADSFFSLKKEIKALADHYEITIYHGGMGCEIVKKGINKAVGLKDLCDILEVPVKSTLAIGDNANDVEMLQFAGIGVAVANAVPEAKNAADYVCRESYTDGVLEAIHKFVL